MNPKAALYSALDDYSADIIKEMVADLRGEGHPYKQNNLTYLLSQLPEPQRVRTALSKLDEADKLALTWLHSRGGQAGYSRVRDLLKAHDLISPSLHSKRAVRIEGKQRAMPLVHSQAKGKTSFESVVARLTRQGLLFSRGPREEGKTKIEWLHGKVLFLPDYVLAELDQRPLMSLPERTSVEPPHTRLGNAATFQRDLGRVARHVRRVGTVQLTTQGALYKTTMRELADLVSFPVDLSSGTKEFDNGRLYFIRRLLPKLDLVEQRYGNSPMTAVPDAYFWQLPLADRIDQCFRAWRDDGAWSEFHQLHHYKRGLDRSYDAPQGLKESRRTILQHLKRLGSGWVSVYELLEEVRDQDYGFLFEKRQYSRSSWGYYGYGSSGTTHPYGSGNNPYGAGFEEIRGEKDGWDKVEADFINHVLAGPLHWLGLVHLGYSSEPPADLLGNRHIDSFCLTPYGEWLVGLANKPETAVVASQIIVQPNFEVVVMGNSDGELLLNIDQFADSLNESEHVATFSLSRESVYRGQQGNWPLPKIVSFLEAQAGQPIPQNVRRTLEEWGALQERIVIRRGVRLMETAVSDTADALEKALPPEKTRRLNPTLLISEETTEQLAEQLTAAQHFPKRSDSQVTLPSNSIMIDVEGNVDYTQRIPSLFVRRALRNITADTGKGRVLTEPLVKTAVEATSFADLLSLLRQLHRGPLPHPLVIKLKAWCDYYGEARQQTVTLLEFKDEATRDELISDPELSGLLTIFPASGRALALAQHEQLEAIHTLLKTRGVTIQDGL